MSDGSPERFLYVVGTSFTGSTLLSFLLNLHPQIVGVGEMTGPFRGVIDRNGYPCSCGAVLRECPFWTAVGREMAERGLRFDPDHWDMVFDPHSRIGRQLLTRSLRSNRVDSLRDTVVQRAPRIGRHIHEIAQRNEALVSSARSVAGKPILADASKDGSRARLLDRTTALEPFIVHLVRDSLGFVASKKSRASRNRRAARGARIGNASRYWNRSGAQAERLFATLPPQRRLRVRYEDLCVDPERELGRICELLGLEKLPGPYDFLAGEHHIIGNRMRLSSSSEIALDERWRSILTEEEAETVRRSTARHRQAFGYG